MRRQPYENVTGVLGVFCKLFENDVNTHIRQIIVKLSE